MERTRGQLEVLFAALDEVNDMLGEAVRSADDLTPGLRSLYLACVRNARAEIRHTKGDSLQMARELLKGEG